MSGKARSRILWLLALALLAFIGWRIATRVQWNERELPRAFSGEAARDDYYAAVRLFRIVGATVEEKETLEAMPPTGAVLYVTAWNWGVLPARDARLQAWVEGGGHLVLSGNTLAGDSGHEWIPVHLSVPSAGKSPRSGKSTGKGGPKKVPEGSEGEEDDPGRLAARALAAQRNLNCRTVRDDGPTPSFAEADAAADAAADAGAVPAPEDRLLEAQTLRLCSPWGMPLSSKRAPQWELTGAEGVEAVRVRLGQGTVTVVRGSALLENRSILRGDDGLVAIAALQVRPGLLVWILTGGGAQPLLEWLWDEAWPVLILLALALALFFWRSAPRFGPRLPEPTRARRSMGEQIAGTSDFLWQREPAALHAAQLRALEETAALRVRNYRDLSPAARALAIGRLAVLDSNALARAWVPRGALSPHELPRALAILEGARRRLLALAPGTRSPRSSPHPHEVKK